MSAPGADYAGDPAADGFGTSVGLTVINQLTGVAYTLTFGPLGPDGFPTIVWVVAANWGKAKSVLGRTWADAKRSATTWAQAKAVVAI
jgi:hypothetical protein